MKRGSSPVLRATGALMFVAVTTPARSSYCEAFSFDPTPPAFGGGSRVRIRQQHPPLRAIRRGGATGGDDDDHRPSLSPLDHLRNLATGFATAGFLSAAVTFSSPAWAENELSAKYGGGLDTSLVDQTCLVDRCSLQAKACLADDPDCRKGLTCTAKCLGDNACITGCMARYGDKNLDNLLKCTIEDNECIKVAILPGGADNYGEEPRSPAPTVRGFDPRTLEGSWYKVVGYNPNYDCYACQRNSFAVPGGAPLGSQPDRLQMDVEFSMPHMLPDGSPPPPTSVAEIIKTKDDGVTFGSRSIGLNDYNTRETMVFDANNKDPDAAAEQLVLNKGTEKQESYSRTAHSEGEMFGLKFWENWYIIGENDPDEPEFKFVYYNGKTRQNTYEGAFVYSRTKELAPESMKKVYKIAKDAGMKTEQFCRIRNGCFSDEPTVVPEIGTPTSSPLRGILASTRVSELLGVEPVAARDTIRKYAPTAKVLTPKVEGAQRPWWNEVGDYFENPHRHFEVMSDLRVKMDWPDEAKRQ